MNRPSPWTAANIVTAIAALFVLGLPLAYIRWTVGIPDAVIQRHSQLATVAAALGGVIGVLVLVFYTKETYLLRKAAEGQTENSVKPVVLLDIASIDVPLGTPMRLKQPAVENVGTGPAFNVTVKPLIGTDVRVTFTTVRLIPAQQQQALDFTITQNDTVNGMAKNLALLGDLFQRSDTLPERIAAVVEFDSITGKRYRTVHEINKNVPAKTVATSYLRIEEIG
jgi:hypothetical protein